MRNNLQGTLSSTKPRHHSPNFAEKNFARKCSWRCIAIFFVVLAVILSAALAYITGKIEIENICKMCKQQKVLLFAKSLVQVACSSKETFIFILLTLFTSDGAAVLAFVVDDQKT